MPDDIDQGEMPQDEEPQEIQDGKSIEERYAALEAKLERAEAALSHANRESASRRKRLEAFEQQEEERKQAEMTELEKAQKKLADLQREQETAAETYADNLIRMEIRVQAATMGFASPDDAYHLVDKTNIAPNEDGGVDGVVDALKALAKAKPYLLSGQSGPPAPNVDAGAGSPPSRGGEVLTAEEKRIADRTGMSYEDYAKIKAERKNLYSYIPGQPTQE